MKNHPPQDLLLLKWTRIPRKRGHEFQLPQIRTQIYKNSFMNRFLLKTCVIIFHYIWLFLFISFYILYWIEPFIHDLDGKDWLLLSLIFSINTSSSSSSSSSSSMVHISISTNKKCSLIFNYKSQCEISKSKYSNH